MRKAGRKVDEADLPPALEWEEPVWRLYVRLATQWRVGFGGAIGLDYVPAIKLIEVKGWDVDRALDLLRAIERETLDWNEREREKSSSG